MNLSHIPLFHGIEENEIPALLHCLSAIQKDYKKGEVILAEGQPTESIGIVLSGMVVISNTDVWGNNSILGSASPGMIFAEAYACIPGEPLLISAVAAENTSVLFMNIAKVLSSDIHSCGFRTQIVRNLLSLCAQKNLQLSQRILHTGSKSIRGRLLSYFSECVKRSGSYTFEIPYNRQQLADYLGVDRSAMCHELSKMQKDGLIRCKRNRFEMQS